MAAGLTLSAPARAASWQPTAVSDSLGTEVDAAERTAYHLFPGVKRFVSAWFFVSEKNAHRLEYEYDDETGRHRRATNLSAKDWNLLRQHIALVEQYRASLPLAPGLEAADVQYSLALKYASRARYEVSRPLLEDLLSEYPSATVAPQARATWEQVQRLVGTGRGLYAAGPLIDQGGRSDLMVFAGYYGIWTGIAIPLFFESESAQAYAAGLLIAPPVALVLTHEASKNSVMGEGRAAVIALGGELATWQGIGWSAMGDTEGNDAVGIGLVCGLAGIAAATALTNQVHFTEGHGALTHNALFWGTWLGLVVGEVAGAEDDGLLAASLVGADALVLGTGIAANGVQMSKNRARLISLMGVVGTAFGFGLDLLAEVEDEAAVLGIAGAGSVAGLAVGAAVTKNYDQGRSFAAAPPPPTAPRWSLSPEVALRVSQTNPGKLVPVLGVHASF